MTRPKLRIGLRTLLVVTPIAGMLLAAVTDWIQRPTILPPQKMLGSIRPVDADVAVVGPTRVDVLAKLQRVTDLSPSAVVRTRLLEQRVGEMRVYPMVGPARHHHAIYECLVSDDSGAYRVEIDHNHLRMVSLD